MGNKILGKRSRSFYKGFNSRQIDYLKEKFQSLAENGVVKKELFIEAYKMNDAMYEAFLLEADFADSKSIDEYEFICMVSAFCNMTVEELAKKFFAMATSKASKKVMKQPELLSFTSICLNYNAYLQKKKITDAEIKKANRNKFLKYDFDKSKFIDEGEFCKICTKDEDYKNWMFNMGFITKKQMDFQDQVYDLVDSDVGDQVDRHLNETNPNVDRIKRGVEHRMQDDQFQVQEVVGEQYSPTPKPWLREVEKIKQADLGLRIEANPPSQILSIDYVLGYRSFDCRNNLKFDSKDSIVYHQAALGIVMSERLNKKKDQSDYEQSYLNEHKDDISCLDIYGDTVATGEVGTKPKITIWDTNKVEGILASSITITKQLTNSVGNVCFSPSKTLFAATCNDQDHKLVIYNLKELQQLQKNLTSTKTGIVASGPLTKSLVFDIKFSPDQKILVAATVKEVLFISFDKGVINSSRGVFNNFSVSIALCLLPINSRIKNENKELIVSGMGNGSIYFWEKDQCIKSVVGHSGSVSAICARSDTNSFISGDKSGKIIVWDDKFTIFKSVIIPKTNYNSNMVLALSQNSKKQILIGVKSGFVYLLNRIQDGFDKAKVVTGGHNEGTLWGLALHKSQPFLYTGGEDQRLIKWQYRQTKSIVKEIKCPYKIRSIDFNNYNKLLLVGFLNGVVQCYGADTLDVKEKLIYNKIRNPDQQTLNIVRFDHYGKYFVVAYSMPEFKVVIFGITDKQIKLLTSLKFTEKVISLDLSKSKQGSEKFLRVNTEGFKFQIYDISKDKPQKILLKDYKTFSKTEWDSHTVAFSPETRGCITEGVEESDITCCTQSLKYKNVFMVGDKYSKLKLFNFPSVNNKIYNKYEGHSNAVTAIQFNHDEDYVVSIGGEEKSIILWRYDPVLSKNQYAVANLKEDSDDESKKKKVKNTGDEEFDVVEETGEQSMATSQYKGQIKAPRSFVPNIKKDNKPPKEDLKIYHAFGIRNKYLKDQVRNHCKFFRDFKSVVYPTACLVIKQNVATKNQDIFLEHREDIVSFAIDDKRQIMATGQMAEKNLANPRKKILAIYVWDIENKKMLQKLDGFHTIAIVLLAFSPTGKLLFTCGNDDKNTFAVYDWRSGSVLYSGPVSNGKVNGICWKSETEFMTCGNDHVKLWQNNKGRQGQINTKPSESMVCCIVSNNIYISGSAKGNLFNWSGNVSSEPLKAHVGKVQALFSKQFSLYSGGDDGKILKWKKEKNGSIKIAELFIDTRAAFTNKSIVPFEEQFGVLSLDFVSSKDNDDGLLIATRGCSVIHHSRGKFSIITQGHYKGQLWGLATNSTNDVFITGGDDKTMRCWDIKSRSQMRRVNYQQKIRAVDWSNNGRSIVAADSKAKIYLYDDSFNLNSQYTGKPYKNNSGKFSDGWVEEIKFSPSNQYIAYGTHGESRILQFLKVNGAKLTLFKQAKSGTSALLHLDWSRDSTMISFNTQAAQLLFAGLTGNYPSASSVCDEGWATWTQKLGFPVQGIFQGPDLTDINSVCRDPTGSFLAAGYDDQLIRIFRYPCYIPKQVFKEYRGHSSHVTRIRFCPNYMVSTGGEDKTIIVWEVLGQEERRQELEEDSDGLEDLDDQIDIPNRAKQRKKKKTEIKEFFQAQDQGDEFMAVKPWLGAIKQPTYEYPKQNDQPPKVKVELEYVHGYRTKDCRQNLYYSDAQTLIFHAAAVLIYHNTSKNTQNLFTDHNDDILSIDFHKDSGGVLTGELGPKPIVNYYRNMKLVSSFQAPVTKGVLAVAISPDGSRGVCAGMDQDHWIALLDLQKGAIIKKQKGSKKVILKIGWVSNSQFVTVGINHFKHWTIDGAKLTFKQCKQRGNFVSLAIGGGMVLTGASAGTIFSWRVADCKVAIVLEKPESKEKKDKNEQQKSKYTSVVESISIQQDFIAAGTKDGYIFILDKSFKKINLFVLSQILVPFKLKSQNTSVRALSFIQNKMLVGTFGSQIYQLQTESLSKPNPKIKSIKNHLKCHYSPNNTWTNQVWGLYIEGDLIFTCSDDATVRCWSLSDRRLLSCASINVISNPDPSKADTQPIVQVQKDKKTNDYVQSSKGRSVCLSPDKKLVIVGTKNGTVKIYNFDEKSYKMTFKLFFRHAQEWISDIKFGYNILLIGSHDNGIYVYDYDDQNSEIKRKYKPLKKHSSYITHLDVSRDSCYLQSTCGAYELLFWDINTGKQITSGATMLRDERWATWTCNLGWPVQGIYPKCTDGTFIHSVDRSNLSINSTLFKDDSKSPYLLAGGNNNGRICVYNYPCTIKNSKFVEGVGHSSHITNVRWNQDDQYIVSIGGEDQCLMYWKVRKNK